MNNDNRELLVTNEEVQYPGLVAVQVSFNNQQFTTERVVHKRDPTATYKFYQEPIITFHAPPSGPSVGGTKVKIHGYGFAPNDGQRDIMKNSGNYLWARYLNVDDESQIIAGPFLIEEQDYNNELVSLTTPPQPAGTKAVIQISLNSENWISVRAPHSKVSFTYYDSPHVERLDPSFGPVKNKGDLPLIIHGSNFRCDNPPCNDVKVRFGTVPDNVIYVDGKLNSDGTISCKIPMYTKPDVLPVEVSINGIDYSKDNKTFGFFDPYVIDVQPRLIAVDGSTKVNVKGIGFVNSGETKTQFSSIETLKCENDCKKPATFIDKNHIESATLPQSEMKIAATGQSIMWDAFFIEASVYSDQFTTNRIPVYYYEEATYEKFYAETPANI